MNYLKVRSRLFICLLFSIVSSVSFAADGTVVPGVESEIEPSEMMPCAEGEYSATPACTMKSGEFEKLLPKNSFAALKFIFNQMNEAEQKLDRYTNIRFEVSVVSNFPENELYRIAPDVTPDTLTIKLQINKRFKNNAIIALIALAEIKTFLTAETIDFAVSSHEKYKYFVHRPILHPKTGDIIGYHPTEGHWVHDYMHSSHEVITYLGISPAAILSGSNPVSWAELYLNALAGSQIAQREMAETKWKIVDAARQSSATFKLFKNSSEKNLKKSALELAKVLGLNADANLKTGDLIDQVLLAYKQIFEADMNEKAKLAKANLKERERKSQSLETEQRKKQWETMSPKLEAFVKQNDRESVARLLEDYVPFEELEPVESAFWRDWISAIRKPDPSQSLIIFRGIDMHDPVQNALDKLGQVNGYGFFSTILTKNQGNYTRRLRSIGTRRLEIGNVSQTKRSPLVVSPQITAMMKNHSGDPRSSLFMSFSLSAQVAYDFSGGYSNKLRAQGGGFVVAKIDRRRAIPNVVSILTNELELLVPLIVFPDEVIHFEAYGSKRASKEEYGDGSGWLSVKPPLADIIDRASKKLGSKIDVGVEDDKGEFFSRAYDSYYRAQKKCEELILKK